MGILASMTFGLHQIKYHESAVINSTYLLHFFYYLYTLLLPLLYILLILCQVTSSKFFCFCRKSKKTWCKITKSIFPSGFFVAFNNKQEYIKLYLPVIT